MLNLSRNRSEGALLPKVLFFIAEDWNVVSHFLPLIREAIANGCEAVVATRTVNHRAPIEAEGARVVALSTDPRSKSQRLNAQLMTELAGIARRERPDIVYCLTIRICVIGGLAARRAGVRKLILAPTGLGHVWIEDHPSHAVMRPVVRFLMSRVLSAGCQTRYVFENAEDPKEIGLDGRRHAITVIGGAGVDPAQFPFFEPPNSDPIRVAIVSRLTRQKGIAQSIAAVEAARRDGANIELHLFGDPDAANPSSFSRAELHDLTGGRPGIVRHGPVAHASEVWRTHDIALLLSFREGLPRALVEASACGRPMVATDVVGCRAVVRDGVEGFLVPLGDVAAAAAALKRLADDPGLRRRMGIAARRRFDDTFTEAKVREKVGAIYRELLARR